MHSWKTNGCLANLPERCIGYCLVASLSFVRTFFEVFIYMIHQLMPKPPAIVLLQGGLANQLLQAALIANEEQIPVNLLSVSDCLFNSRLRSSRSVTKHSISSLFVAQLYGISRYRQAYLRMRLRLSLARETLHDGALFRVYSHGQRVYKGDGLSPSVFSSEYNCFWFSVLRALDELFGAPPCHPTLAIHVRRGDYYSTKTQRGSGLYPLPLRYYISALELLQARCSSPLQICLFSDSQSQVQQEFASAIHFPFEMFHGTSVEEDLWRMSFSSQLVLSNSTLSCVAAHLSKLRNGHIDVVAPSKWFLDGFYSARSDLRQPWWIQL